MAFSLQLPGFEWEIGSEEHCPQVEAHSNVGKCEEEGYSTTCGERVCAIAPQSIVSSTILHSLSALRVYGGTSNKGL